VAALRLDSSLHPLFLVIGISGAILSFSFFVDTTYPLRRARVRWARLQSVWSTWNPKGGGSGGGGFVRFFAANYNGFLHHLGLVPGGFSSRI
jgi:hypothetical protein